MRKKLLALFAFGSLLVGGLSSCAGGLDSNLLSVINSMIGETSSSSTTETSGNSEEGSSVSIGESMGSSEGGTSSGGTSIPDSQYKVTVDQSSYYTSDYVTYDEGGVKMVQVVISIVDKDKGILSVYSPDVELTNSPNDNESVCTVTFPMPNKDVTIHVECTDYYTILGVQTMNNLGETIKETIEEMFVGRRLLGGYTYANEYSVNLGDGSDADTPKAKMAYGESPEDFFNSFIITIGNNELKATGKVDASSALLKITYEFTMPMEDSYVFVSPTFPVGENGEGYHINFTNDSNVRIQSIKKTSVYKYLGFSMWRKPGVKLNHVLVKSASHPDGVDIVEELMSFGQFSAFGQLQESEKLTEDVEIVVDYSVVGSKKVTFASLDGIAELTYDKEVTIGDVTRLNFTAEDDKVLADPAISVTTVSGKEVELKSCYSYGAEFIMPNEDVVITFNFAELHNITINKDSRVFDLCIRDCRTYQPVTSAPEGRKLYFSYSRV